MLKRWKTWLLTFCLVGIVLCALESQRILTGWLRGEAFYQGRPTSYWRGELEGYRNTSFLSFSSYDIVILEKKWVFWKETWAGFGRMLRRKNHGPSLLVIPLPCQSWRN